MLYQTAEGRPLLRRSLVAFIDVLGFSDMSKKATESGDQEVLLLKFYDAIREARNWLTECDSFSPNFYEVRVFTDNIVIGYPINSDNIESEFGHMTSLVSILQIQLANSGFFVRGAITIGDICIDEVVIFGDGLIKAYEAERDSAKYPRIIMDEELSDAVKSHFNSYYPPEEAPQYDAAYKDADGITFINYLDSLMIALREAGPFVDELIKHKNIVEERLSEHVGNPTVFEKYLWSARYHNFFVSQYQEYFDESQVIQIDDFTPMPTRLWP